MHQHDHQIVVVVGLRLGGATAVELLVQPDDAARPAPAPYGIFESIIDLSDNGDLMSKLPALPCTRKFMYGEQNASLSQRAGSA